MPPYRHPAPEPPPDPPKPKGPSSPDEELVIIDRRLLRKALDNSPTATVTEEELALMCRPYRSR